jgi:hypothetical protein
MDRYDPAQTPSPSEWNALAEQQRLDLVEAFHRAARVRLPNPTVHAAIHVIVENQLALGIPAVTDALRRLCSEGLDRHEALHAVGSVLIAHLQRIVQSTGPTRDPNVAYEAELERLTAAGWRAGGPLPFSGDR